MLGTNITFTGVKGVGTVALELQPDQRVYTLIGVNGVGKTKTLESLFQLLFFTQSFVRKLGLNSSQEILVSNEVKVSNLLLQSRPMSIIDFIPSRMLTGLGQQHELPIVFLVSQNRGFIQHYAKLIKSIGSFEKRRTNYLKRLYQGMKVSFSSTVMDSSVEEWFVSIAQSSNPYQKQEDNREIEIETVLKLLHEIDSTIDAEFMEISGDDRVSLKIDGQKRELSHLSTGFASILKMIQAIVSGYGYFTNETQLQNVKGIVLIDEIESHLHLSWQAHIIPLLKRLFPNTTFYITTHSSIVLSQLEEGEAYRLERDDQGVVRTHLIKAPNKAAMVDVLKDAFGIDLNQMKLERMSAEQQQTAKQRLLSLINQ
ncbi:MAG: AAA family ATPase [Thiothrix sp.]|uniref:AAA family ATPase n=1 Tax=Thiothrix sp. TaxID=1032 RepID=UPI002619FC44|nr:AAA family ATPase [Thiothrix sp.]MDD5393560.1 AAA family ATPase [Thiothrix sp.]